MAETVYNEIIEDKPVTLTVPSTAARLLGENYSYKYVLSYLVRVRSMGTATYIALGNKYGQDTRLTIVGQCYGYQCGRYEVIDLTKKYIVSDTSDAIVEITVSFLPMSLYGKVRTVAGG